MRRAWIVCLALAVSTPRHASAEAPPAHVDADAARADFVRGIELAKRAEWAEAAHAFEASIEARPHPVTHYNLALCLRALGQPVRATDELRRALAPGPDTLPDATRLEAERLLTELEPERAEVRVERACCDELFVDGHPLEQLGNDWVPSRSSSARAPLPAGSIRVTLDPGLHEIRVLREGHHAAPWHAKVVAGERLVFWPAFRENPGQLVVTSTPAGASVRVDGAASQSTPLTVSMVAGPHRVEVSARGYQSFSAQVLVRADGRSTVHAPLSKPTRSVLGRWWFWTGVATVVAGGVVLTYALTRPDEPASGGSLGWVVR